MVWVKYNVSRIWKPEQRDILKPRSFVSHSRSRLPWSRDQQLFIRVSRVVFRNHIVIHIHNIYIYISLSYMGIHQITFFIWPYDWGNHISPVTSGPPSGQAVDFRPRDPGWRAKRPIPWRLRRDLSMGFREENGGTGHRVNPPNSYRDGSSYPPVI